MPTRFYISPGTRIIPPTQPAHPASPPIGRRCAVWWASSDGTQPFREAVFCNPWMAAREVVKAWLRSVGWPWTGIVLTAVIYPGGRTEMDVGSAGWMDRWRGMCLTAVKR